MTSHRRRSLSTYLLPLLVTMCPFFARADMQTGPTLPPQIKNYEFLAGPPPDNVTISGNKIVFAEEGGYILTYVGPYFGKLHYIEPSGTPEIYKLTPSLPKPLPNAQPGFSTSSEVVLVPEIDTELHKKIMAFLFFDSPLTDGGVKDVISNEPSETLTYEQQ